MFCFEILKPLFSSGKAAEYFPGLRKGEELLTGTTMVILPIFLTKEMSLTLHALTSPASVLISSIVTMTKGQSMPRTP